MFRLRPLIIVLLLVFVTFFTKEASAHRPASRVWPTATTTYRLTTEFTNQGQAWVNIAHDAANAWTSNTIFNLVHNSSSNYTIEYHVPDPPYDDDLAETYWWNEAYRTRYRIVVNPNFTWYDGTQPSRPIGSYDLKSVLVHEFGHAVGLGHVPSRPQVMYEAFRALEVRDQVTDDEKNGVKFLYDPNFISPHPEGLQPWGPVANGTYDDADRLVGIKGRSWTAATGLTAPRFPRNNTLTWSDQYGATAWFHATTDSLTWEYTKHYLRGNAEVYIDGNLQGIFNLNDPDDTLWRVRRTWTLPSGPHVIEVRNISPGWYMDVDAFIAGINAKPAGGYDDFAMTQVEYLGNWTHSTCCPAARSGTISWSNTADNAIVFTFRGNRIRYWFTKAYNRGIVQVTIDGDTRESIDLYSPVNQFGTNYREWSNLGPGIHTIHLVVTGEKNAQSQGFYVDLDQFEVFN